MTVISTHLSGLHRIFNSHYPHVPGTDIMARHGVHDADDHWQTCLWTLADSDFSIIATLVRNRVQAAQEIDLLRNAPAQITIPCHDIRLCDGCQRRNWVFDICCCEYQWGFPFGNKTLCGGRCFLGHLLGYPAMHNHRSGRFGLHCEESKTSAS